MNEMFPAAEADLQSHSFDRIREEILRRLRGSRRKVDEECREQGGEPFGLLFAQRLPLAATEEGFGRAAPAFHVRHAAALVLTASLRPFTRSVRSQENEPSRPALRPK